MKWGRRNTYWVNCTNRESMGVPLLPNGKEKEKDHCFFVPHGVMHPVQERGGRNRKHRFLEV